MAVHINQTPMWEGVQTVQVTLQHHNIEVTSFGDAMRRFVSGGPPTVWMELQMDLRSYELPQALLQTQGEYEPDSDHVVFRVKASDMANAVPASARKPAIKAAPPLALKSVRMVNLE